MPGHHALLSPSSSHRWISCPASVRLTSLIAVPGESSSEYAEEGTHAHSLGELKARHRFGMIDGNAYEAEHRVLQTEAERRGWDWDEMEVCTDAYVDLIADRMKDHPHSTLRLERRVVSGIPECWGTADAIIISPVHVETIDLKYGQGIRVEARGNTQLRAYSAGALDSADLLGEVETVKCTVFQPRLDHVSTEVLTAEELRAWRESVIPIAVEALEGSDRFGPSEEACRFCPAAGDCKARMEAAAAEDFGHGPDLLTPDEVSELYGRLPEVKSWLADFEKAAMRRMYDEGQHIPGWKLVFSGGRRAVVDEASAVEALKALEYSPEQFMTKPEPKILGIGALEKLVGKEPFRTALEEPGYVAKGQGSPTIVPETDPRPPIDPHAEAARDFAEEQS